MLFKAVISVVVVAITAASSCEEITSQSDCTSSSCSWCTSAAVGDSCMDPSDAASLPSAVFTCTDTLEKMLHHGDLDSIRSQKKVGMTFLNVTGDSASSYVNDPLGYTTLYHSEIAYCGAGVDGQPSYMDRNYDAMSYTKTFVPSLYVHSDNSKESLRGYIGFQSNVNSIIISFRGSEDLNNWITNIAATRSSYDKCDGCSAHSGFQSAAKSLWPQVSAEVNRLKGIYPSAKITVTGHSLGAALATLIALDLIEDYGDEVLLYNYGCPRIFNQAAADWASSSALQIRARRTHYKDLVVHSPPYSLGYRHTVGEIYEDGPSSNWPTWPGGPLKDCVGEEDDTCADQYNVGAVPDHLLYSGMGMGADNCAESLTN